MIPGFAFETPKYLWLVYMASAIKPVFNPQIWDYPKLFFVKNLEAAQRCSVKKVLLEISQNSQENNCVRVSFLKKLDYNKVNNVKLESHLPKKIFYLHQ